VYETGGLGGCSLSVSGKTIIFGRKLHFSGRSQQPKMKKVYLLNGEKEFILSSEIKCPKSGSSSGWCESGKVILQVSIAVSFGRCRKIFRAKMALPPRKNDPYAYGDE